MAFHIPHCLAALWGQHPKPVETGLQIPQTVQGRSCWVQWVLQMTTVQANLAPGCSASPAPRDGSEVPGYLRLQLPLLPRFCFNPHMEGGKEGDRDILS